MSNTRRRVPPYYLSIAHLLYRRGSRSLERLDFARILADGAKRAQTHRQAVRTYVLLLKWQHETCTFSEAEHQISDRKGTYRHVLASANLLAREEFGRAEQAVAQGAFTTVRTGLVARNLNAWAQQGAAACVFLKISNHDQRRGTAKQRL